MENLNAYQKAIEVLNIEGHSVLQVFPVSDDRAYYFLLHKFTPAQRTAVEDIQFNQIIGVNITEFLRTNAGKDVNMFRHALTSFLAAESTNVVRIEFPNHVSWIKFSHAQ